MIRKVQSAGINKDYLIKIHQERLLDLVQGKTLSDEKLREFTEFSRLHSQTLLFGVSDLAELDTSLKLSIYSNFDPDYGGLNEFIQKEANTRDYESLSDWLLEKLKFIDTFFTRAFEDIPSNETEDKYLDLIDALEIFLQGQFAKVLLPELVEIENEIRDELTKIYNNDSLSEEEATKQAFDYLDQKEKEAIKLFEDKIQAELNNEALTKALLALAIFNLVKPSQEVLDKQVKIARFGYMSNIGAFFANSFRRVKEVVFENISQGANQRSLATDQLEQISFNKNIFKLSVLAHPRGLFRAILAISTDTNYFKAVVPKSVLPNLKASGETAKILYTIKTKDEWSKLGGSNVNVVNGLGLHHGSQEYYVPILGDLDEAKKLAGEQRKVFLSSIS
jgi:hypothetical protein